MTKVYLAHEIETDSILDGPGLRAVIWFQGCAHNCKGCHNPETHQFKTGIEQDTKDVFKKIDELKDQDGITFSGGDAFFQIDAFLEIIKYVKKKGYKTWVYTGFLFEDILKKGSKFNEVLKYIDVLVDGPFIMEKKSFSTKYRGSSNQRLIDVKKSLEKGKTVIYLE